MDTPRRSAVLIPFVETEEGLSLLFEVRAGNISDPGEVCFPGGRIESGESPREAAVRETCEELGMRAENIEILGENDLLAPYGGRLIYSFPALLRTADAKSVCSAGTAFGQHSAVSAPSPAEPSAFPEPASPLQKIFFDPGCLQINEAEVREVFTIPLSWLMANEPEDHSIPLGPHEPEGFSASVFGVRDPYPWRKGVYELPLWKYKGRFLWGLTARMVQSLLRILQGEQA